ncbi:DNA translocase FtsK [Oceanomicrobium pacificus]|uniref:DNA translocase FtsK n=1 Tax=Oceanomicrobium pacificus TaxID=2692916 RepID=A0A6B0U132_9RHOB|nr:DNA translocase FtsK [Oceanomicrobium pacificus]MXU64821.1 DNA translocase FtsK [Oceanomicrobium pacificus]
MVSLTAPKKAKRASKSRKALVESQTSEALRKRGREALGLAFVVLAGALAAMMWTYDPTDPSFFNATGDAPNNALGLLGASLADPLHRVIGWAAYGLPVMSFVWGGRLIRHRGEERVLSRTILAPIAFAVASVFAAAHVPPADWPFSYGLGGMFGDSVLGMILSLLPLDTGLSLLVATLALAVAFIVISGYALGLDKAECAALWRGFRRGLGIAWSWILTLLSLMGVGARRAAVKAGEARQVQKAKSAERRAAKEAAVNSRFDQLRAGVEEPAPQRPTHDPRVASANEDRLMARISAAVRARKEENMANGTYADGTEDHLIDPSDHGAPYDDGQQGLPALGGVSRDMDPPLTADTGGYGGGAGYDAGYDAAVPAMADAHGHGAAGGDPYGAPAAAAPPPEPAPALVQGNEPRRVAKSRRAKADEQPQLALEDTGDQYQIPPLTLLESPTEIVRQTMSNDALAENARMLESVLDDYGVKGEIVSVKPGPVVTMYELEPAPGLKASRVIGLADDIARSMSALAARVSTVPGRSVIGIELPNESREKVLLREILSARAYGESNHKLPLALGKDIGGEPVVANLARMPHLLIAGTTGSGKSVAINTMILSLLYSLSPEECRLIMIDPKMLELSVYDGIPHLLSPVVTDPKKAVVALKWTVAEMEERYRKMSKMGVRNIDGYNARVEDALRKGEGFTRTVQTGFDDATGEPIFETEEFTPEKMPFIVVIVDEMADLMMVAGKEIEACIQRLAQMARASGIHIVMATQRPSVDVITGTIKANFPTRISFSVTSKVDSRTILGEMGAEQLLGMGDMLYMAGGGRITRVHGPFVSDEEVEEVVTFLKGQGVPEYVSGVVEGPDEQAESQIDQVLGLGGNTNGEDALYDQAVAIVARDRKCSTSYIQRKLAIGYNKAARLVEQMEEEGVVSAADHVGKREILLPER